VASWLSPGMPCFTAVVLDASLVSATAVEGVTTLLLSPCWPKWLPSPESLPLLASWCPEPYRTSSSLDWPGLNMLVSFSMMTIVG
jgi:hypothetical protein